MGVYVTTTSIFVILPGFLKPGINTVTSDTTGVDIFSRQIINAEAKVNAVIASKYNITLFSSTAIPPLLRKLTEDIAVYNVISKTGYRADDRNEYMDDYKTANDTLGQIIDGKIGLTYTDGSSVAVLSSKRFLSDKTGYTPIFGLDNQKNWKRDEDEIDDQSNARG